MQPQWKIFTVAAKNGYRQIPPQQITGLKLLKKFICKKDWLSSWNSKMAYTLKDGLNGNYTWKSK